MSAEVFKVGSRWHYRFQVAGKRVQRSTRQVRKGRAQEIADRAYDAAVIMANGGKPVPTLYELIRLWLDTHRPVVSVHHIASVERFRRLHLYDLGSKLVTHITTEDVERCRNLYLQDDHQPASANHWLRILKLLTLWAVRRKMLMQCPWSVKPLKVQQRPRPIMPLAVVKTWLSEIDKAAARAPAVGTAVRLMFGLGLRESETITARWEWIDWERLTYTPGITKGKEAKPIPLPAWLVAHLRPLYQVAGLIAFRPDGSAFGRGFARYVIGKANASSLIVGITPHRLRGSFATLLSQTVPVQDVQDVMRHKHHGTTMGYLEKGLASVALAQQRIAEKAGLGGEEVANDAQGGL